MHSRGSSSGWGFIGALLIDCQYIWVDKTHILKLPGINNCDYLCFGMKKLLASFTLISYLAMTCGVVINFHYCMDRLASTQFFGGESKICGKCGMHKDPIGCCQDEIKVVKIDDDQQTAPGISDPMAPKLTQAIVSDFSIISIQTPDLFRDWQNHSPPLLAEQDICIQNSVFRI
jgi:hypothetical protein